MKMPTQAEFETGVFDFQAKEAIRRWKNYEDLINFVKEVKRVAEDGMLTPTWVKEAKRLIAQAEGK